MWEPSIKTGLSTHPQYAFNTDHCSSRTLFSKIIWWLCADCLPRRILNPNYSTVAIASNTLHCSGVSIFCMKYVCLSLLLSSSILAGYVSKTERKLKFEQQPNTPKLQFWSSTVRQRNFDDTIIKMQQTNFSWMRLHVVSTVASERGALCKLLCTGLANTWGPHWWSQHDQG